MTARAKYVVRSSGGSFVARYWRNNRGGGRKYVAVQWTDDPDAAASLSYNVAQAVARANGATVSAL